MLSSREQRIWDDIERFHAAEAEQPVLPGLGPTRRRDTRGVDDRPAAVAAGENTTPAVVIVAPATVLGSHVAVLLLIVSVPWTTRSPAARSTAPATSATPMPATTTGAGSAGRLSRNR
ncbi:hypothetical protein [Geodermatophilus sp. URMC 60]